MNKEIKITEDNDTMGYLYLCVEYTNKAGSLCKLVRTRSNYGRGKCPILKCTTNKNVALYIDGELINNDWYSASITNNENRINIHNQLLSETNWLYREI